jgi:hypothetical protein
MRCGMRILIFLLVFIVAPSPAGADSTEVAFNKCKIELLKNGNITGNIEREYIDGKAGKFITACMISKGFNQRASIRGAGDRFPNIAWACDNLTMPECFEEPPSPTIKEVMQTILRKLGW